MRFILVVLVLVSLPATAGAQMYRWVDAQGEVHITDDPNSIPEKYRPRGEQAAPQGAAPPPSAGPGPAPSVGSPAPVAPMTGKVTLWLRTGGMRGEQEPILIQTYDSEAKCLAERDRRTAVHVSQGMQQTSQPGLAISNLGVSAAGSTYFAYRCVPAGLRPP
jgi:Domain of unknown function (DUF4124)